MYKLPNMKMTKKGQAVAGFNINFIISIAFGVFILLLLVAYLSIPTGEAIIDLTNTSLYNNSYINDAGASLGGLMTESIDDVSSVIGVMFTIITIGLFVALYKMVT